MYEKEQVKKFTVSLNTGAITGGQCGNGRYLYAAATGMAVTVLRCFAVASLPVWPLSFTLPSALRGAGDAKFTMIVSILSMWICRIVVSYILVMWCDLGILGVWIGMFVDWYVRGICYSVRYCSRKWLAKEVI